MPMGVFLLLAVCWSCTPSRYVRPLAEGETAVTASLGGPMLKNFDAPIPVPNISVAAGYGVREDLTAFGGLNLLSGAFGNIHLDLGVSKSFLRPEGWKPGLTVTPGVNLVAGLNPNGGFRVWPVLDANAWWEYGQKGHYCYAGLGSWFVLSGQGPHETVQPQNILPAVQLGNVWSRGKWDYVVEFKWNNFSQVSRDGTVDWQAVGNRGALGMYVGITKRLGK